jgi:hypothetical protein
MVKNAEICFKTAEKVEKYAEIMKKTADKPIKNAEKNFLRSTVGIHPTNFVYIGRDGKCIYR